MGPALKRRKLVGKYHLDIFLKFLAGKIDLETLGRLSAKTPDSPEQLPLGIGTATEEPRKIA